MDFLKSLGDIFSSGNAPAASGGSNVIDSISGLLNIDPEIINKITEIENDIMDLTERANDMLDLVNKYGKLAAAVFAIMFLMIAVLVIVSVIQTAKINKLEAKVDELGLKLDNKPFQDGLK